MSCIWPNYRWSWHSTFGLRHLIQGLVRWHMCWRHRGTQILRARALPCCLSALCTTMTHHGWPSNSSSAFHLTFPFPSFRPAFPFLIKKQVRDFLCHQPITLCTEFVQNFSALFEMLLVVVGFHLMLDGPHALRCVLSNIRCFMRSIYLSIYLSIYPSIYLMRSVYLSERDFLCH